MKLTIWLKKLLPLGFILSVSTAFTQQISLDECYRLAEQLSPLKQKELFLKSIQTLQNQERNVGNLPAIVLKGSGSYQSEVFQIPFNAPPGQEIPQIPKEQFNFSLGVTQKIYDGGLLKAANQMDQAEIMMKEQELAVSLNQIKSIINEVYFGIINLQENHNIIISLEAELDNQLQKAEVSFKNGVMLGSAIKSLQMEKLKTKQKIKSIEYKKEGLLGVLSEWIGEELNKTTVLSLVEEVPQSNEINRPELELFTTREALFTTKENLVESANRPKVFGFVNAGYGSPNPLNIFETGFEPYYMMGAKLEWNIKLWGSTKRQKEILSVNRQMVNTEKENFINQINRQAIQLEASIKDMESAIETDTELLKLQEEILVQARQQFELGVRSSSDYVSELNEKTQTELMLSIHQTTLKKHQIELLTLKGNTL